MSAKAQSGRETLRGIVDRLEEGDEFQVHAGEFIVDEVIECASRPMVRVRKKSASGYMQRTYRLEWADPTDEDDETLVIKTKYKSHWSEWARFGPEKVEVDEEDEIDEDSEEQIIMTDGGVDTAGSELETERIDAYEENECLLCEPAGHPNCEKYTILSILDPANVPLGEDDSDHMVEIPVCMCHYEAIQQYQGGKNVEEVEVR